MESVARWSSSCFSAPSPSARSFITTTSAPPPSARRGAEVLVGDLTRVEDVSRALDGVRRIYFGLSVSPKYVRATVTTAVLARDLGQREVFVNISQMTVSQMSATRMTDSAQQREHWLAEQVLDWSGLPVVHLRPTVFLENPLFRFSPAAGMVAHG